MTGCEDLIRRIVDRARIPTRTARDELKRELDAHFDDALAHARAEQPEAHDLQALVRKRFGDPDEIGAELARVHRFERHAALTAGALGLIGVSVLAVAAIALSYQLLIATWIGIPLADSFPHLRGQIAAFVALTLGYMSLYLEESALSRFRLAPAFLVNLCAFAPLFVLASPALHLRTVAPGTSFVAGALVRLLQRTPLRPVWWLGVVLPTTAAVFTGGRLLNISGESPIWISVLLRGIGQAAACYALTVLSERHRARRSGAAFCA